jgi:hypothetical protein
MRNKKRSTAAVLILAALALAACTRDSETHHKVEPAHVVHIDGTELSRLTLTPKAMERLDIQTAFVQEAPVSRSPSPRKVVPYAAVLYDVSGRTWVYTRTEAQSFVRARIVVDYIEGNVAVLSDGPPIGTAVVTVGGAELFGTEFDVGH